MEKVKVKTLFFVFCKSANRDCPYEVARFQNYSQAKQYIEKTNNQSWLNSAMDCSFKILELEIADNQLTFNESEMIICFSVNGTLSKQDNDFNLNTVPDLEMIKLLNDLSNKEGISIKIHTSVYETKLLAERWLHKNNINIHSIHYERPKANIYVDSNHLMYNRNKIINKINHDILRPSVTFETRINK